MIVRRYIIILIGLLVLFLLVSGIGFYVLRSYFVLDTGDKISIIGFGFVGVSIILSLMQIRINYNFNKRKAAVDFTFKNIEGELFPILREVKKVSGKTTLIFNQDDDTDTLLQSYTMLTQEAPDKAAELRRLVLNALNFYERMSVAILKETFDEDICYDDHGFNLIQFYNGVESWINRWRVETNEPRLFANFEEIAKRWRAMHKAQSGQKVVRNRKIYSY